ncbi:MAG: hypothetical protein D6770_05220 [Anaerolineae bacterium]|nr:MAG: hypothetical protein D6770_05220 [Anaerolineae bacterium]
MTKLDLKKEFRHLYTASARRVDIVDVPPFNFAMIDGQIDPGMFPAESPSFQEDLQAIYGVSYTLKFMSKLRDVDPIDYKVMALEGLWWTESGDVDFERKEPWYYTLLMMQPEHITAEMFYEAVDSLRKKRGDIPALARLRFESFHEGLCMQILHVGPYDLEPMTIARMRDFAAENGYRLRGLHHEIYLSDPRRAKPERLRTILRHPIEKVS